jgi:dihydroorotate dehydrogenase subfamily 1
MANLKTKICGITFPNPIWTAAGPGGANANKLLEAAQGGAGGLVAKTISVMPARVPIPNISSPSPGSLLNAELWSELDYQKFIEQELPRAKASGIPIIASLGYSPDDLRFLGEKIQQSKVVDAIEFSIHYVGKDPLNLKSTAKALKETVDIPIWVKLSPTISDLEEVVETMDEWVDGYVAINSTGPALDFDIRTLQPHMGSEDGRGWLSGRAILPLGLHFVELLSSLTKKAVIGVGGIRSVEDVIKYFMVGASAIQICSMAVLKGQKVYGQLAQQLSQWMDQNGYKGINDLKGIYQQRQKRPICYLDEGTQLYPEINYQNCKYCDLCVKACMHGAISFIDKEYLLDKIKCVRCWLCTTICPYNALHMAENSEGDKETTDHG